MLKASFRKRSIACLQMPPLHLQQVRDVTTFNYLNLTLACLTVYLLVSGNSNRSETPILQAALGNSNSERENALRSLVNQDSD